MGIKKPSAITAEVEGTVPPQGSERNFRGPASEHLVRDDNSVVFEEVRQFTPFVHRLPDNALPNKRVDLQPQFGPYALHEIPQLPVMNNALRLARMRVPLAALDWVIRLIGPERAAMCECLPRASRVRDGITVR
jgi:hypothetical protein